MRYIILFLTVSLYFTASAQIISGENETDNPATTQKKDVVKEKIVKEKSGIELYFGVKPAYTFRTLKETEGLFGKPLGTRADEKGAWTVGYSVGVRNRLNDFLKLDIGVGFSNNRETYEYADNDSIYNYINSYRHISIPIRLAYTYGDNISFYGGIGIIPKAFLSMKKELTTYDAFKKEQTEKIIERDKYNLFLLDAVVDLGIQMKIGPNAGVYIMLEGTRQLVNNYEKQSPYVRKAYSLGFNCGLEIYL